MTDHAERPTAASTAAPAAAGPIGVFDSGLGGLSVLREIRRLLPAESVLYLADQGHVPYAPRPAGEVAGFAEAITRGLLAAGAKIVVVACHTASVAALGDLRRRFPGVPFVGMDPAIKPAIAATRSGRIGVLATAGTFRSGRYASLVREHAHGYTVIDCPCPGLVERIEAGLGDSIETAELLRGCLEPLRAQGVDTLVLGCTHFPLIRETIQRVTGPAITLVDPAPAVARQVGRLLAAGGLSAPAAGPSPTLRLVTTGDGRRLGELAGRLLDGQSSNAAVVEACPWPADGAALRL
ncbi:MAG: glutamate racemase [Lentisphaerae bacterium]|nr:glutamate racemase [Lentisphaerota bacterium]